MKEQCKYDQQERKHMKVDDTKSKDLKFGTKQTTWKDIGVDLDCKTKKGGWGWSMWTESDDETSHKWSYYHKSIRKDKSWKKVRWAFQWSKYENY